MKKLISTIFIFLLTGLFSPFVSASFFESVEIENADSPSVDSFGRLRVSQVETIFESKLLHNKMPQFWEEATGGGVVVPTHSQANANVPLVVDANGEYIIRQTYQRFNYQSGKSQLINMTFTMADPDTVSGVVMRAGYFNSNEGEAAPHSAPFNTGFDGLYLEIDGDQVSEDTEMAFCIAKSGSVTRATRSIWDDPMDGTGRSGIDINFNNAQIMFIDFGWLGFNRVRWGFVVGGKYIVAHETYSANVQPTVFISNPNHSLRYEIRSTGGTGTMNHNCVAIMSEGGQSPRGRSASLFSAAAQTLTTVDTEYALLAMRLDPDQAGRVASLVSGTVLLNGTSDRAVWTLRRNPLINGAAPDPADFVAQTDSPVEVAQYTAGDATDVVSGGTVIASGLFVASGGNQGSGVAGASLQSLLRLGLALDGTPDTFVLSITCISAGGATCRGAINWMEF